VTEWPATPLYVYDQGLLRERCMAARNVADRIGAALLYSVKACSVGGVVTCIAPSVDGFSCSSVFETRIAAALRASKSQSLHFYAPAIRPTDAVALAATADYVTLNSFSQWQSFRRTFLDAGVSCGLRLNPRLSFADDVRYDPCRHDSKLGIVPEQLLQTAARDPDALEGIAGLHVHNNSDSFDLGELAQTIAVIESLPASLLERLKWINIGGGYFLHKAIGVKVLTDTLGRLRARYPVRIFLEPGATFVRDGGFLVSRVVDILPGDSMDIAVLDSTVNHYPNYLTYGSAAHIASPVSAAGGFRYTLAGGTCLAGDLFGEFEFAEPLHVGQPVVIESVGAYGVVKMHMFNGVPLPDVYLQREDGTLTLLNSSTYDDYVCMYVGAIAT
jgi:carboxynorspermidine decarboxylase